MESTILKFKSIVINLLHDKNSILKNLSLEDRNFLSLHYDILPTQMQKDLVKLHPSILENQVLAKEAENDSALIKKINSEELEDFDLVDDLENFFNELEKSAASSQDFKTEIKIQIPKSNPRELEAITLPDDFNKIGDNLVLEDITLNDLNNGDEITDKNNKIN